MFECNNTIYYALTFGSSIFKGFFKMNAIPVVIFKLLVKKFPEIDSFQYLYVQ